MTKPQISIALGRTDQVADLASGHVRVEGADINCIQFDRPAEIHFRFILYKDFDVAEMSLGKHASMVSQGLDDFVGLPIFTSRTPRHSSIYLRKDRGIRSPKDLEGKRIGVAEWAQTAAIYARGALAESYGVDLASIDWLQAGRVEKVDLRLPAGLRLDSAPEKNLNALLVAGDIDAAISAMPPRAFLEGDPNIGRLFENYVEVERAYYQETGVFPIMHMVAIRKEIATEHPWLAANLLAAFETAKTNSMERALNVAACSTPVPWAYAHAKAQQELFGKDFWPYGVEPNRKTLEAFLRFAREQGVCHRAIQPEELFADRVLRRFTT